MLFPHCQHPATTPCTAPCTAPIIKYFRKYFLFHFCYSFFLFTCYGISRRILGVSNRVVFCSNPIIIINLLLLFLIQPLVSWWNYVPNDTFVLFLFNHSNIKSFMLKSIIKSNNEVPKDKPFIFHHSLWRIFVLFLISVYVVLSTKFPVNQLGHVIIRSFVFFSVPALCTHSKYNLQSPLFCLVICTLENLSICRRYII